MEKQQPVTKLKRMLGNTGVVSLPLAPQELSLCLVWSAGGMYPLSSKSRFHLAELTGLLDGHLLSSPFCLTAVTGH